MPQWRKINAGFHARNSTDITKYAVRFVTESLGWAANGGIPLNLEEANSNVRYCEDYIKSRRYSFCVRQWSTVTDNRDKGSRKDGFQGNPNGDDIVIHILADNAVVTGIRCLVLNAADIKHWQDGGAKKFREQALIGMIKKIN